MIKDANGNKRKILTEPLSNYNLFIFDQQLKNNCSFLLLNTNVTRNGKARDANVTTAKGSFENKKHQYQLNVAYSESHIFQWENYENGASNKKETKGRQISFFGDKISGNSWFGGNYRIVTKNYDKNDLGLNFTNDYSEIGSYYSFKKFNPFWKYFKQGSLTFYSNRTGKLSKNNQLIEFNAGINFFLLFNNNWSFYTSWGIEPIIGRNFYEPRIEEKFYNTPKGKNGYVNISTNYNNALAFDMSISYNNYPSLNNTFLRYYLSPRIRLSDHFNITLNINYEVNNNDHGFAYISDGNDSSFFGKRNISTIENTITSRYIFKNDMSLSLSARHYWSKGEYNDFFLLNSSGDLSQINVSDIQAYDFNSNYMTIDLVYNWQFAPGSSFLITYKNLINSESIRNNSNYFSNLSKTISDPQHNSISVKFLYYIDYQYFTKRN